MYKTKISLRSEDDLHAIVALYVVKGCIQSNNGKKTQRQTRLPERETDLIVYCH